MGDRRIAKLITRREGDVLFIYSHWSGYHLPQLVRDAYNQALGRLDDDSYWLRIMVDQITKSGRDGEYGWGLMLESRAEDEYNGDEASVILDASVTPPTLTIIDHATSAIESLPMQQGT